jgi:hypothetical protein
MATERDPNEAGAMDHKRSLAGKLVMLSVASLVSVATSATEVPAASSSAAVQGQARVHRGMAAPLYNQAPYNQAPYNQAPSMPPPVFNPSTPYTAPTTPEVPVSPASPGSVFGNGP